MNPLLTEDGNRSTTSINGECWQSSSRGFWRKPIISQVLRHAGSVTGQNTMSFGPSESSTLYRHSHLSFHEAFRMCPAHFCCLLDWATAKKSQFRSLPGTTPGASASMTE